MRMRNHINFSLLIVVMYVMNSCIRTNSINMQDHLAEGIINDTNTYNFESSTQQYTSVDDSLAKNGKIILFSLLKNGVRVDSNSNEILLGQSKKEAISKLDTSQYHVSSRSLHHWGYSGGGYALVLSRNNMEEIALLPNSEDRIIGIVILSNGIRNDDGLGIGSSVEDIIVLYPTTLFEINIITGNEECTIPGSMLTFVFETTDSDRIGDYKGNEIELASKAVNLSHRAKQVIVR